jgi:hypothetical protein
MKTSWLSALLLWCVLALVACGGNKPAEPTTPAAPKTLDSDPLALFPSGPLALARVDAKAVFAAGTSGAELAKLAERFLPIGEEVGFSAARDLSAIYAGSYSMQGVDALVVLTGSFNVEKIQKAADDKTPLKGGTTLTASPYAGRTIYTSRNVGFSVLTPHTVLAGTEAAIRRALDRCRDGVPTRNLPDTLVSTLETAGADGALAADLSNNPIGSINLGPMQLPGTAGLKVTRVLVDFKAPGLNVAGTLTYDTEEHAQAGAEGLKKMAKFVSGFAAIAPVPKLQNFDAKADKLDVQAKFAVDDKALRDLLVALPGLLN